MLTKKNRGYDRRLYYRPDPAKAYQAKQATFEFKGKTHTLDVGDNAVDEVVLNQLPRSAKPNTIKDVQKLAKRIDGIEEKREAMDAGEEVKINMGTSGHWTGRRDFGALSNFGESYIISSPSGRQELAVSTLKNDTISSFQLRTDAIGINHDINGKVTNRPIAPDIITVTGEGVSVSNGDAATHPLAQLLLENPPSDDLLREFRLSRSFEK